MKDALEVNREYSDSYVQKIEEDSVPKMIKDLISRDSSIKKVIDLGCGDGGFIKSLRIFDYSKKIAGVDISPRRIRALKSLFPGEKFHCRDVCNTGLKEKFDLVYSSQVIEHVSNDKEMAEEAKRLAGKGKYVYFSSVIKKPLAIYKYRNRHGKFALDPTHEREYKDAEEFLKPFSLHGLKLIKLNTYPVRRIFLGMEIRIPGYYIIEGLWRRT